MRKISSNKNTAENPRGPAAPEAVVDIEGQEGVGVEITMNTSHNSSKNSDSESSSENSSEGSSDASSSTDGDIENPVAMPKRKHQVSVSDESINCTRESDCSDGCKESESPDEATKVHHQEEHSLIRESTENSEDSSNPKVNPNKLSGKINYNKQGGKDDSNNDWAEDDDKGVLEKRFGSPTRTCCRDGHVLHTMLYLLNFAYFLFWFIREATADCSESDDKDGKCYFLVKSPLTAPIIWFIFCYCPFLYEFFRSSTFKYLRNIESSESLTEYYDRLRQTAPEIILELTMFHIEIHKTRHTSVVDGNYSSWTSRTEKRKVTHKITGTIDIADWHDASYPLSEEDTAQYAVTKVKLSKEYVPNESFQNQITEMINKHRHLDQFYELDVIYNIPGFKSHFLAVPQNKPMMLGLCWGVLAHLTLVFALPYRIWMTSISGKVEVEIKKLIYAS